MTDPSSQSTVGALRVDELTERLRAFRDARNWGQFHTVKDLAISISVEAAELLEIFQWRTETVEPDGALIEKAKGEVADVFLYLLLLCDKLGIDLVAASETKIAKNEIRFPVKTAFGVAKPNDESTAP
jgi:NTP pyrophosphatase (non-canonical NTP hydrolase)